MTHVTPRTIPQQHHVVHAQEVFPDLERRVSVLALGIIASTAILITLQPPASIILASAVIIVTVAIALDFDGSTVESKDSVRRFASSDTAYLVDPKLSRNYPPYAFYPDHTFFRRPVAGDLRPVPVRASDSRREARETVGNQPDSSEKGTRLSRAPRELPVPVRASDPRREAREPVRNQPDSSERGARLSRAPRELPVPVRAPDPRREARETVGNQPDSSERGARFSRAPRELPVPIRASYPEREGRETVGSRNR